MRNYVARRKMKVGNGWRYPGDPVPEANNWRNVHAWVSQGRLEIMDDNVPEIVPEPAPEPEEPAPAPEPVEEPEVEEEPEETSGTTSDDEPSSDEDDESSDDEDASSDVSRSFDDIYSDLTVVEITEHVESGALSLEDVDRLEIIRSRELKADGEPKGYRKSIFDLVADEE